MINLSFFKKHFSASLVFAVIAMCAIGLFSYLGVWQIQRGKEKQNIIIMQKKLALQKPIAWTEKNNVLNFQPISVQGHYLDINFLLDNQHLNHEFGFNVISAFLLDNDKVVLVDRGWVKSDIARRQLPNILNNKDRIKIAGTVYQITKKPLLLGNVIEKRVDNTVVVEAIDFGVIAQILQKNLYPFIIRLDKGEPFGFVREWKIVSMTPQRHFGYAFQWFSMALCILVIYISLKIKYENKTK